MAKDLREATPVYAYIKGSGQFESLDAYDKWRSSVSLDNFDKYTLTVSAEPSERELDVKDFF